MSQVRVEGLSPRIKVIEIGRSSHPLQRLWGKPDYVVIEDPDGGRSTMRVGDELFLNIKLDITDVKWGGKVG